MIQKLSSGRIKYLQLSSNIILIIQFYSRSWIVTSKHGTQIRDSLSIPYNLISDCLVIDIDISKDDNKDIPINFLTDVLVNPTFVRPVGFQFWNSFPQSY
jgi:hypothetical protein